MASPKLAALELISSARLEPTEHLLLKQFVEGAVDPDRAAQYLLSTINTPHQDVETSLRCFKADWRDLVMTLTVLDPVPVGFDELVRRRDGPYCSISSIDPPKKDTVSMSEPAYIIPPSMFHSIHLAKDGRMRTILDAFLSPLHIARLKALLQSHGADDRTVLQNLWLLSPSIQSAFRGGHVNVEARGITSKSPETELQELDSAPEMSLVGVGLFGNGVYRFNALARRMFYRAWLYVPQWARMRCYYVLVRAGRWLYGVSSWQDVQLVPFGLVIKDCLRSYENEVNALRLVAQHTSVPAPRIVDTGVYGNKKYLVMPRLPGQMLGDVLHLMSYAERDRFANKLGECVAEIRQIPNSKPYLLCDTLGGPLSDHRIPDTCGGPFNTEEDFNDHLTSHMNCTSAVFFSGQTPPQNHIDGGQLSGIVDWESAGYKPEYWEYTKAVWTSLGDPILQALFRRAFEPLGNYEAELAAERKLWRYTPFGV
ncbi:hypothetical protein VF21_00547 [Pseudogymnoascus sp. 05NY08]|nr:hypothetical protein VF21_00547 [Pseudogymnoascus sp. 05NY08]